MFRLEAKLQNIRSGRYKPEDFIIADAKDGDMGSGLAATGFERSKDGSSKRPRTRAEFLEAIKAIIDQDIVDIMLVSVSNLDRLNAMGAFKGSAVKPAIRGNDTTDCWGGVRHGTYAKEPSYAFRTADLSRVKGTDLALYSVTFLNDLQRDAAALEEFRRFRKDVAESNFKYFYEVFNPNVETGMSREEIGAFVNDSILRSLGGVGEDDRPEFLKIVYNGPKALEELASFDPQLVVGVLGGGAGTTRDTFELLHQAERYGARVALFGRKINLAEDPLALLTLMRQVASGTIAPEEAVKAYHGELQKQGITPARSLEEDRAITEQVLKPAATLKAA
jgi:hypothetical protein